MISGTVNSFREAVVRLVIRGPQGQERDVEAVVDTGFSGSLTLPRELIISLELPFLGRGRAFLADGGETVFDFHEATVLWEGRPRRIQIDMAETDPLLGMGLLYGSELTIEVGNGGRVAVRALAVS